MEIKTGTEQSHPEMFLLFYMHFLCGVCSSLCLQEHTGV